MLITVFPGQALSALHHTITVQVNSFLGYGVDSATIKKIEDGYNKLNGPEGANCKSLLKKVSILLPSFLFGRNEKLG